MPISGYPPPPDGINNNASSARGWGPGWPLCQEPKQRWINLSNGVALQVRFEISELTNLTLNECLRRGYLIRDPDSAGYVCRAIANTLIPSNHSWGLAFDINWRDNPMSTHTTNIPRWMVELMWSFRFYWGGWYNDPDPMHFEFIGTPADAVKYTAAARKAYTMTQPHPEVDLVKKQEDALAEVWAVLVALRDGVKAPKAGNYPGGFTQLQFQLDRIEDKLDQLLARPTGATVEVSPSSVGVEGSLRFVPITDTP
jgi:D-alanyl-D-alanine carboxypeptidase